MMRQVRTQMFSRVQRATRGFTILELCLSLVVVTLTATLSIWAYFSRAEVTLAKAAELLAEDLRVAQMQAACTHSMVEIVFDPKGESYHVVGMDDPTMPSALKPRCYPLDAVFEGVQITDRKLGPTQTIVFDARGRTAHDASVTLSFRGEARTVVLRAQDGVAFVADGATGHRP